MRVTELRVHPIAVADPPLRSSYGRHAPYALRTILEVKSGQGLTGVSETYGGQGPAAALEAVRDSLVGMDPFQLTGLWLDLQSRDRQKVSKNRSNTAEGRQHCLPHMAAKPLGGGWGRRFRLPADSFTPSQGTEVPGGRTQTFLVPGENPLDRQTRTFAAIEIACLDLIGKAVGKPVCDLAGGRAPTRARTSTARRWRGEPWFGKPGR